ncbi:hypothetical protein CC78DRAFT_72506 [Lojkania enalia]|uniref:Uncharacterized protein n=1 Tax=Lojkania enalia TaxID=147567 RepID=A0A9P4JZQ8_9PLEO|nr:hypothetical protein CC78DRAFT_72506 [Didymosphaeria enalia]
MNAPFIMPVAALTALYPTSTSHAGRPRAPYQCLDNSKIKKLVIVFRNYPSDPANADEYWRTIKHTIQDLPTSLRSLIVLATSTDASGKLKPGKLCTHHNGLRADLIYSIWAWVKHELDSGIGIFLYPILVKAGLPMLQEWKVRQLEPVQRMWRRDFDALEQTPEGRQPIISDKWSYQENQCPACMLARIGSDTQVLSALYAGMVGRYSSKKVGKKDKSRSNRVNFIRYLLKQSDSGEKLVDESWDLGKEMKRVREGWREHQRDSVRVNFYGRKSRSSISSSSQPRDSCILINTSELFDLNDNVKSFADPQDSSFVACSANTGCTESGIGVDISDLAGTGKPLRRSRLVNL